MPKSSYFALRQWQRSMEQEVGEDEFSSFKRDIMGQGERFHKVCACACMCVGVQLYVMSNIQCMLPIVFRYTSKTVAFQFDW